MINKAVRSDKIVKQTEESELQKRLTIMKSEKQEEEDQEIEEVVHRDNC